MPKDDETDSQDSFDSAGSDVKFIEDEARFRFDRVLSEEAECIDELRSHRAEDGNGDMRFSVAFSGGGIRAAAFQAGVLWQLAQQNKLRDVEYLTAVSGGSYIASALATHVLAEGEPTPGRVREWYLKVVAKTMHRMQVNAGDFVRDCVSEPCFTNVPSGPLPRFLDLPVLLLVLFSTLMVHPIFFVVCFLVPFMLFIETYFGAAMRAVFCSPPEDDWFIVFCRFSKITDILAYLVLCVVITFTISVIRKTLPWCRLHKVAGQRRRQARTGYLLGHSMVHLFRRLTWCMVLLTIFVIGVPLEARFTYSGTDAQHLCAAYILRAKNGTYSSCTDLYDGKPWYDSPLFSNVTQSISRNAAVEISDSRRRRMMNAVGVASVALGIALALSICVAPLMGSALFGATVAFAGPVILIGWLFTMIQYSVFGPITLVEAGAWGSYSQENLDFLVSWSLRVALVLLPFYDDLRAGLHLYYRRCLKLNFFAEGEDVLMRELAEHPYCPFVVLTGTSNDFQPPDDNDKISELSFSALHFGGEETGYVREPAYRTLSKCTAISGAGCLDAISLSMSDALSLRFWLEVLNLSWGDYLIFDHFCCRSLMNHTGSVQGMFVRLVHRLPSMMCVVLAFVLLNSSWGYMYGDDMDCPTAKSRLDMVGYIMGALIYISFFTFNRFGQLMAMSPLLRQVHQVTKYYYVGNRPPPMLYMTDGGVKDCTSIVQLLWRRRERILLVLAAADPEDELKVFRTALEVATQLRLASFYDPRDPRRSLDVMFEEFKEDKEQRTLHVGISYCFDRVGAEGGGPVTGHLFVVKNRLPPSLHCNVKPKIPRREVMRKGRGGSSEDDSEEDGEDEEDDYEDPDGPWQELKNHELGPFACCDCCHTSGMNCGPKFPHGTFTGYLYLSPCWCSSLMRLGYEMSEEAVRLVSTHDRVRGRWESELSPTSATRPPL